MESGKQPPAIRYLAEDYEPSPNDVLCGRGRRCYFHAGNVTFRDIVQSKLAKYSSASSKMEKGAIISEVYDEICESAGDGGFIKKDEQNRWYDVGEFLAREKVSQAFRDALQDKYKSSTASKKKRRELLLQSSEMSSQRSLASQHSQRNMFGSQRSLFSTQSSQRSLCSDEPTLEDLERIAIQNMKETNANQIMLLNLLDSDIQQTFGQNAFAPRANQWKGYNSSSFRGVDELPVLNRRQQMMQAYAKPSTGNYEVNKSCPILAWKGGRSRTSSVEEDFEPLDYTMDSSQYSDLGVDLNFVHE